MQFTLSLLRCFFLAQYDSYKIGGSICIASHVQTRMQLCEVLADTGLREPFIWLGETTVAATL